MASPGTHLISSETEIICRILLGTAFDSQIMMWKFWKQDEIIDPVNRVPLLDAMGVMQRWASTLASRSKCSTSI
jgi:hypothetical protein